MLLGSKRQQMKRLPSLRKISYLAKQSTIDPCIPQGTSKKCQYTKSRSIECSTLNLISISTLEESGIPPSKLSHASMSILGYDCSTQRPISKIKFKLWIDDPISKVTVYAIKTPSCYNILLRRPCVHENGVGPSIIN
jgi:hypothetical protein